MQIWKYTLNDSFCAFGMPKGAKFVRFAMQNNEEGVSMPTLWAIVDPTAEKITRRIRIVGTGHDFDSWLLYIGSCEDRQYIWHALEEPL